MAEVFDEPTAEDMRAVRLRRFAQPVEQPHGQLEIAAQQSQQQRPVAEVQQPAAGEHQQWQPEVERQPDVLQLIGAHERSDESGSDSSGEESDVPGPMQDSDGLATPQPSTRAAARRRQRQRRRLN